MGSLPKRKKCLLLFCFLDAPYNPLILVGRVLMWAACGCRKGFKWGMSFVLMCGVGGWVSSWMFCICGLIMYFGDVSPFRDPSICRKQSSIKWKATMFNFWRCSWFSSSYVLVHRCPFLFRCSYISLSARYRVIFDAVALVGGFLLGSWGCFWILVCVPWSGFNGFPGRVIFLQGLRSV